MTTAQTPYPAIVAVGYNRPDSMRRLLNSVRAAAYPAHARVPLIVSIDECGASDAVAAVAEALDWPYGEKTVRRFPVRQGLRSHILQCGDLSETYGAVIVLEDDLVAAKDFYGYVLQALARYGEDASIAGVSLYSHAWNGYADREFTPQHNGFDAYLGQFSISWGQCWTRAQWRAFRAFYDAAQGSPLPMTDAVPAAVTRWPDTSWAKYFVYYIVQTDRYYVVPYVSLSTNFSDAGQHAAAHDTAHQVPLSDAAGKSYRFPSDAEAVRYDIFFERMRLPVEGFASEDVCMDLNGAKLSAQGRRYRLTMRALPFRAVAAYGLTMRPIEANVVQNVAGDAILLYDTTVPAAPPAGERQRERARLRYELYGIGWRTLLPFALSETLRLGLGRLRRALSIGGRK